MHTECTRTFAQYSSVAQYPEHGGNSMQSIHARFVGVELYFDDLERAKKFYQETLGLAVSDEQLGHYAKFDSGGIFVCLERKGAESYPPKTRRCSSLTSPI